MSETKTAAERAEALVHTAADRAFVAKMYREKGPMRDQFTHAELVTDWVHPGYPAQNGSPGMKPKTIKAGTTVLITVASSMGDMCFRAENIHQLKHGYDARWEPENLCNYRSAK